MLESAGYYSNVLKAVQRVFLRVPHLVTEIIETMKEEGFEDAGASDATRSSRSISMKARLVELTMEKVKEICTDFNVSQSLGMSSQINSYIAFLDIVLVK